MRMVAVGRVDLGTSGMLERHRSGRGSSGRKPFACISRSTFILRLADTIASGLLRKRTSMSRGCLA